MSRLDLAAPGKAQTVIDNLYKDMERRLESSPPGCCPVDMTLAFLRLCHAQSCGKCVPCRIGLGRMADLIEDILDGNADAGTLDILEKTAATVAASSDCAIGREGARLVLDGLAGFRDEYLSHIEEGVCLNEHHDPVPCVALCPAGVDIPGYIALVKAGRYDDAVRLIRKDNPMPTACAYICEHPCESHCRRSMVDAPLNICGLKRFAVDNTTCAPNPECAPSTGKRVAVIGGGPSGLTCAYYLTLMGHSVTIFEQKAKLGGMLRYGIPSYRFPREKLDEEIASILSLGIEVRTGVSIGKDISIESLREEYDCVYIAIGAQTDKKIGIEGEDAKNVMSAVALLGGIGDGVMPDFSGKEVVIIGGGNVAMDATRTSVRLGAKKVTCVYRRRKVDMTALPEEVEGAAAEGAEIRELAAPVRIEVNENGEAVALWVQPQVSGAVSGGRPRPEKANLPEERIPADIVIAAIGQNVVSAPFEAAGIPTKRGGIVAKSSAQVSGQDILFAGGDCVTGPATAIRAIAAGKVAAANIDAALGFHHEISVDIDIPAPNLDVTTPHGRINTTEVEACERKCSFDHIECGMTEQGACMEASRCLRCDRYGYGLFRGGRVKSW